MEKRGEQDNTEETSLEDKRDVFFGHINSGKAFIEQAKYEEAEKQFLNALEAIPDHSEALVGLLRTFVNAEKFAEAAELIKGHVVVGQPGFNRTFHGIAQGFMGMEGYEKYHQVAEQLKIKKFISSPEFEEAKRELERLAKQEIGGLSGSSPTRR